MWKGRACFIVLYAICTVPAVAQSPSLTFQGRANGVTPNSANVTVSLPAATSCPSGVTLIGIYALNTSTNAQSVTGTVGGVAATVIAPQNNQNGTNNGFSGWLSIPAAAGPTVNVSLTFAQPVLRMEAFSVSGCNLPSPTPSATAVAGGASALTPSLTMNAGDLVVIVTGSNSGNASAWSGATQDADTNILGTGTHAALGHLTAPTTGAQSVTVNWGAPGAASNALSAIAFSGGGAPPPPPPPPSAPAGTIAAFVAVPVPVPPSVGSSWTSPSPLPPNDAVQGSCGSLACWTFDTATQSERQTIIQAGGPYDLLIGDSIIALCDQNLFSPYRPQNFGIPGNTVNGLVNQIAAIQANSVSPQVLASMHALIVQIGVNDIGTLGLTAAQIEARLQVLFNSYSGPLIWSGILPAPSNTGWGAEIAAINSWASGALASRPHTHDISAAVTAALSSGGAMNAAYQLIVGGVAGIHYNGAGCQAWGALVMQSTLLPF